MSLWNQGKAHRRLTAGSSGQSRPFDQRIDLVFARNPAALPPKGLAGVVNAIIVGDERWGGEQIVIGYLLPASNIGTTAAGGPTLAPM